jgi:hypothetical protein
MKDPDFLAEAKKLGLDVNPMAGHQVVDLLKQVYATPEDVLKETRELMGY